MRIAVPKEPLWRILTWARRALFACAILLLGYCGFVLADAWNFQRRRSLDLDRLLRDRRPASVSVPQAESANLRNNAPSAAADGLIGRIGIPRLFVSAVVIEGIDKTTLGRGVGHIPGTALPGQAGNVGVAGHRDTFFRGLKNLRIKDEIQFSTPGGDFKYEVESLAVVKPDNVGVLASTHGNVLTLVTCYPFSYIGTAPKRFVVRARQVSPQTAARINRGLMKKRP